MDLQQMQYFVGVADSESMIKAAEFMNVSQSTLSLSIKKLEKELRIDLFTRQGRSQKLTDAGRIFRDESSDILRRVESLRQRMTDLGKLSSNTISLAFEAVDFATEAMLLYEKLKPDSLVKQIRAERKDVKSLLLSRQADFCISLVDDSDEDIESRLVLQEPMLLVVSEKHHLAGRESVSIHELKSEVFIVVKEEFALRSLFEDYFKMAHISEKSILEVGDPETTGLSVQHNFGVTFIPESLQNLHLIREDNLTRVQAVRIREEFCRREVFVSYLKSVALTAACKDFLEFLTIFGHFISERKSFPSVDNFQMTT